MGAYLAILTRFVCLNLVALVVIDDLDRIRVTGSENETYSILVVHSYAPLSSALPLKRFKSVAGRYSQECQLRSRINEQQFSPGAPRNCRWHDAIAFSLK